MGICGCHSPNIDKVSLKCIWCMGTAPADYKEPCVCYSPNRDASSPETCMSCGGRLDSGSLSFYKKPAQMTEPIISAPFQGSGTGIDEITMDLIDSQILSSVIEQSKNDVSVDQQRDEIKDFYDEQLKLKLQSGREPKFQSIPLLDEEEYWFPVASDNESDVSNADEASDASDDENSSEPVSKKIRAEHLLAYEVGGYKTKVLVTSGAVAAQTIRVPNSGCIILATGMADVTLYRHGIPPKILFSKNFDNIVASVLCCNRVYILTDAILSEYDFKGNCTRRADRKYKLNGLAWVSASPKRELITLCHGNETITYHLPTATEYSFNTKGHISARPIWLSDDAICIREEWSSCTSIYKLGASGLSHSKVLPLEKSCRIVGIDPNRNMLCTEKIAPAIDICRKSTPLRRKLPDLDNLHYAYNPLACHITKRLDAPDIVSVNFNRDGSIVCVLNAKNEAHIIDGGGIVRPPFSATSAEFLGDSLYEVIAGSATGNVTSHRLNRTWSIVTILLSGWKYDPDSHIYDFALDLLKYVFYLADLIPRKRG